MKSDTPIDLHLAPREERVILDEIRNDSDLIARLRISPKELEALSKCALLGTLTCKQDMLFILRQIRETTSPVTERAIVFPQPAAVVDELQEDALPDFRSLPIRPVNTLIPEPGSLGSIASRRMPEQFGVLFWVAILVVGLIWNAYIIMSHLRDNLIPTVATAVAQSASPPTWYEHLDRFNLLLGWEVFFVVAIAFFVYMKTQRDSRRFKVRPGSRAR